MQERPMGAMERCRKTVAPTGRSYRVSSGTLK
jgi:hypothetical protein